MPNYPIVDGSGLVINVASWDGVTAWTPPAGCVAVADPTNAVTAGWTYVDGVFSPPVLDAIPLATLQAMRLAQVDALYLTKLTAGATLPGVSAPVQIDDASRANVIGAALQASIIKGNGTITATWPGTYTWRLADNTAYSIPSAPAMILFAIKVAGAYLALRTVAWAHKDAINALTDPNAVAAYDITVNWPS